jgi:hypothetical protein
VGYKNKEARKVYELASRDQIQAYQQKYDLENKERKKAWRKKHYAEHKERLLEKAKEYRQENLALYKERDKAKSQSIKGRHNSLRHALRRDKIEQSDYLWNRNFYEALIQDRECHYCFGLLDRTGGGLDRIENNLGHTCYNVVPCCRKCNRIKGNDTSYAEMMLLAPALREIVRLKSFVPSSIQGT